MSEAGTPDLAVATAEASGLDDIYPLLAQRCYTAGWHKARPSLWPLPKTPFQPRHWRYDDAARLIDRAGEWISTELAERRNLLMFNRVGDNDYASLPTLVAAYQMLKPGEHARAHRHSPNALRLVLDAGEGVSTVVDGVELPMLRGDIVLTPGWTWHSHFSESNANAYWIDFLDVPLVHRMETMFFEAHPEQFQAVTDRPLKSPLRISAEAQEAIAPHGIDGHRRTLLDAPSLRTIGLALHTLSSGAKSPSQQVAANRIFAVVAGQGEVRIGDLRFRWQRGDVFVVPVWHAHVLMASVDSRLLEVSDEPAQRGLGLYRQA